MIRIGNPVFTHDGKIGKVAQVVLDPVSHKVTDLIVDTGGLFGEARVVPMHLVGQASGDKILLGMTHAEFKQQRRFEHSEFKVPTWTIQSPYTEADTLMWASVYGGAPDLPKPAVHVRVCQGVDESDVIVGRGTPVLSSVGERVGSVDHLAIEPVSQEPLYLILRLDGIRPRRVVVPTEKVRDWYPDGIVLALERAELAALAPYTPQQGDSDLADAVRAAIEALKLPLRRLGVQVDQGHVQLTGHTGSTEERRQIDEAARSVEGVLSLENEMTEEALEHSPHP